LTVHYSVTPPAHFGTYFINLFEDCIVNLTSMTVDERLIPLVLTAAANRLLVLRKLYISGNGDKFHSAALRLFALCPELRTLKYDYWWSESPDLAPLPDGVLPNLEFFNGPYNILRAFVPGRPVHWITAHIWPMEHDGDAPLKLDVFQRSTVRIKTVRIRCFCQTPNDALVLLRSLHAFQHLNHLAIMFYGRDSRSAMKVGIMPNKIPPSV
jgi:hypothetical protein